MGIFSRRRAENVSEEPIEADGTDDDSLETAVEEVGVGRLRPEDEARLASLRARYAAFSIDPADATSIQAAFDAGLARQAAGEDVTDLVEVVAAAFGDHLVAMGRYRWVLSVDPFGTDVGVEPPRKGVPVIPSNLVAVRWMRREGGTLAAVAGHLVGIVQR